MVQPAILTTKTGRQRFVVTFKLPEKSLKTASSFVREMNEALQSSDSDVAAQFVLVDSERIRLQRATASFAMFKEAKTCLGVLKALGLPVNDISAELENFGKKQYDPWYESVAQSWWPWLAAWRNPPPEMPMMKLANRLDVSEGTVYKQGEGDKLGKSDEEDRRDAEGQDQGDEEKDRREREPREDEDREEGRKRRKKKKP